MGDLPGAHSGPVARAVDETITAALSELQSILATTEFTPALLDDSPLRARYRYGRRSADGWRRARTTWPVVFDRLIRRPSHRGRRVRTRDERPGETARLAAGRRRRRARLPRAGLLSEGSLALFHMNAGREPIKVSAGNFQVGDTRSHRPRCSNALAWPRQNSA
jgi:hypothetical protein